MVTGATGRQGGAVARHLLETGFALPIGFARRTMIRSILLVIGDLLIKYPA
jgi:uncharacterized protein YbjT (DUF2867 family)